MLSIEQRERLDELRSKDMLNMDQAKELEMLENLEPEDPDQDAFDDAWDQLDGKKKKKTEDNQEDQETGQDNTEDQSTESDTDDLLNNTPDETDQTPDSDTQQDSLDPRDKRIAELQAEIEATNQRMKSWEGRLKAADKRAAEAEAKLQAAEKKGQSTDRSEDASPDEDDAQVSAFFKEYPDLETPIRKVAEKIATTIVDKRMEKIDEFAESQRAIQDTLDQTASDNHIATITKAHPDWKTIYDSGALATWIEKQPSFLQPRLNEIVERGSTQDIIEMFDSYKRAAGKSKATTTNTVNNPAKAAKAKAMEAVPASSAGPKKGQIKIADDDFDGAWAALEQKERQNK